MIALLEQAVALGVLRPLDVQFARVVANEDEPDILLAAACLSAEAGAGHVCLMLEQLQADTLLKGASRRWRWRCGRRPGDRIARVGSSVWRPAQRSGTAVALRHWCCAGRACICSACGKTKVKWRRLSAVKASRWRYRRLSCALFSTACSARRVTSPIGRRSPPQWPPRGVSRSFPAGLAPVKPPPSPSCWRRWCSWMKARACAFSWRHRPARRRRA